MDGNWKTGNPPKDGEHIVTVATMFGLQVTTLVYCGAWYEGYHDDESSIDNVIAWMEMPDAYTAQHPND